MQGTVHQGAKFTTNNTYLVWADPMNSIFAIAFSVHAVQDYGVQPSPAGALTSFVSMPWFVAGLKGLFILSSPAGAVFQAISDDHMLASVLWAALKGEVVFLLCTCVLYAISRWRHALTYFW
jgi:hypothetical protein